MNSSGNCKIISVVGARPNFMKIAPFIKAIENHNNASNKFIRKVEHILVHTGQHYDVRMSKSFFTALGIPDPDINLEVGSGGHSEQVGYTMIAFEKVLKQHNPDWVVVVGDVNATLACSIAAKKECIKVCHIEAGLRSNDLTMPEEINRLVTDRISDLLLTPDEKSSENLIKEGIPKEKIRFVGNIMIDTLESNRTQAGLLDLSHIIKVNNSLGTQLNLNSLTDKDYILITLHRPSNVDNIAVLESIIDFLLQDIVNEFVLVWPMHPRTRNRLITFKLWDKIAKNTNVVILEPLGYHEMLRLTMGALVMITDSGGLQEECCVLGIPCLTMRWNTERPITLMEHGGVNVLVGNDITLTRNAYKNALAQKTKPSIPSLWDGHTAKRCLYEILKG